MWSADFSTLTISGGSSCLDQESASILKAKYNNAENTGLKRKSTSSPLKECKKRRKDSKHSRSLKRYLSFGDTPLESDDNLLSEETYIADGSRPYCLPTVAGQHRDLKSITADTMKDLLNGKYNGGINSYRVIDCRYPYEFNGGHIKNAENCYLEEHIDELLLQTLQRGNTTDEIIIFHCEFSSKRGPKLCRYLRSKDRQMHGRDYPQLHFPEIYLLEGGYKCFYQTHKHFCEPIDYVPMLHDEYKEDVRHFRSKTSTLKRNCSHVKKMEHCIVSQKLVFSMC
ncbi:M-phase inducer phosphatase 1-A-like [Mytilus edulis]|uniref:M-phase inducer phosphatase 1-A-like n=1 Tax=Mytilus edulis TaxID=6550 RepID=UPI0039F089F3